MLCVYLIDATQESMKPTPVTRNCIKLCPVLAQFCAGDLLLFFFSYCLIQYINVCIIVVCNASVINRVLQKGPSCSLCVI